MNPHTPTGRAKVAAEHDSSRRIRKWTRHTFVLNVKLDFTCGDFKLANAVDGHYHFQLADSHRRDRRNDVERQRRGGVFVRFPSDDDWPRQHAGLRQEENVAAIASAVAERHQESLW